MHNDTYSQYLHNDYYSAGGTMGSMKTTACIKTMIERSGMSARKASQALGKSPTYLGTTITNEADVSAGNLAKIADVTGYELVLRGRGEEIPVDPS